MENRSWLLWKLLLIHGLFRKHILFLWRKNTNTLAYHWHMLPIWELLPNSPQYFKLHIYVRYSWNKTRHNHSKQIPWEIRYIHQEWNRFTQMEAIYVKDENSGLNLFFFSFLFLFPFWFSFHFFYFSKLRVRVRVMRLCYHIAGHIRWHIHKSQDI